MNRYSLMVSSNCCRQFQVESEAPSAFARLRIRNTPFRAAGRMHPSLVLNHLYFVSNLAFLEETTSAAHGTPRFSREVFPHMHGVSDGAGFRRITRLRCVGSGLPHTSTASAPRSKFLSRLNALPAGTPVNASPLPPRATTHDSAPLGAGDPSAYGSFIRNIPPDYLGTRRINDET